MRDAVIDRQLQHLRVDHDQAALFRLEPVEQAEDHGVDRHRLARAGGAGDEQVRHAREVGDDRLAADVLAQAQSQLVLALGEVGRREQLAQVDGLAGLVRQFDADDVAAGDDRDAGRDRRHGAGDVVRQADHAAGFGAGRGLELVEGDDRAGPHRQDVAAHAEILDRLLEVEGVLLQHVGIDLLAAARRRQGEQVEGRQLVIGVLDRGDLEVAAGRDQVRPGRHHRHRDRRRDRQGGDRLDRDGLGLDLNLSLGRNRLGLRRQLAPEQDRARGHRDHHALGFGALGDRGGRRRRRDGFGLGRGRRRERARLAGRADRRPSRHGAQDRGAARGLRLGRDAGAEDQRQTGCRRGGGRQEGALDHRGLVGPLAGFGAVILPVGGPRRLVEPHEPVEHVDRPRRQGTQVRDVEGHRHEALVGRRRRDDALGRRHGCGGLRLQGRPGIHGRPVAALEPRLDLGPVRQVGPVAGRDDLLGRFCHDRRCRHGGDHRRGRGELDSGPDRAAVRRAEEADTRRRDEGLAPQGHCLRVRRGGFGQGRRGGQALGLLGGKLCALDVLALRRVARGPLGLLGEGRRLRVGAGALQGDALSLEGALAALLQHRIGRPGPAHGRGRGRSRHGCGGRRLLRRDGGGTARLTHQHARRRGAAVDPALEDGRVQRVEARPVVEDLGRPLGLRRSGARGALRGVAADHRGRRGEPARLRPASGGAVGRACGQAGRGAGQAAGEAGAERHQPVRKGSQGEARAVAAAHGAGGVTVGVRRPSRCAHGFSNDTRNRDPPTRGGCP
ncbi:hypothetical protein GOFOIKOB_6076 [Methylobacterium tardum]|nr:hypothetical protein GOFOIKOB_6076 [Methylobacterium tardum]